MAMERAELRFTDAGENAAGAVRGEDEEPTRAARYNSAMFAGKPIIGIVGGIGSGKSFVARLFGELGCLVINSDEQVTRAYESPEVRRTLRSWWGKEVFDGLGNIDRKAIGRRVFHDADERKRLEELLHPIVARMRATQMMQAADDRDILAYVWDTP